MVIHDGSINGSVQRPRADVRCGTDPLTIGMLSQEKNGRGLSGFGTGLGDGSICPRDDAATANMIDIALIFYKK